MAVKPSEDIQWCESGTHVAEPTLKRAEGYQLGEPFPSNEFNWLERAKGRWLTFLGKMFGSNGRLQMDAANGGLAVTTDSGTELVYELQHDTAAPAAYSELRADRLLGRRRVRLSVDSNAEADGDLQLVGDNLTANTCGVLTIGTKPGHGHLTSSGVSCQVVRPTLAGPTDADQRARFPRNAALYSGNLVKFTAEIEITRDGSGAPSITAASGYNLDTTGSPPAITAASGYNVITFATIDGTIPTVVLASAEYSDNASPARRMMVTQIANGVALWVDGNAVSNSTAAWNDALTTNATFANDRYVINIIGL